MVSLHLVTAVVRLLLARVLHCSAYSQHMQLFSQRGDMPSAAAQRSCWEESEPGSVPPAFLLTHTVARTVCAGRSLQKRIVLMPFFGWRFTSFSSCSLRHSLLHGHARPQRTSAGGKRTCWGSAVSGDRSEEPQLGREDPALHSRHAQIVRSLRGERQWAWGWRGVSFWLNLFEALLRGCCANSVHLWKGPLRDSQHSASIHGLRLKWTLIELSALSCCSCCAWTGQSKMLYIK